MPDNADDGGVSSDPAWFLEGCEWRDMLGELSCMFLYCVVHCLASFFVLCSWYQRHLSMWRNGDGT